MSKSLKGGQIASLDASMEPFKEKTFKTATDYIESLSRKIVLQQQHSTSMKSASTQSGMFDSTPYEESFEHTLSNLLGLREHVDRKLSVLSKDCTVLEKEYKTKLAEIQKRFDKLFKDFKLFDGTINKVSTSAQRIGGSLESVEAQRNRAIETQIFLNYLVALNDEDATISSIFSGTSDLENAIILRNLLTLSGELDMESTMHAKANIEKTAEILERTHLEKFVRASQEKKYQTMKECARILFELNGGDECVRSYLSQLPMFFQNDCDFDPDDSLIIKSYENPSMQTEPLSPSSSLISPSTVTQTPSKSPGLSPSSSSDSSIASSIVKSSSVSGFTKKDPVNPKYPLARKALDLKPTYNVPDELDSCLARVDSLFERAVADIRNEYAVILDVFPNYVSVLNRLVQRVFEQRIANFVDLLLDHCLHYKPKLPELPPPVMLPNGKMSKPVHPPEDPHLPMDRFGLYLKVLAHCVEISQVAINDLSNAPTSIPIAALTTYSDSVFVKHRDNFIGYQIEYMKNTFIRIRDPNYFEHGGSGSHTSSHVKELKTQILQEIEVDIPISSFECAEEAAARCVLLSHPRQLAQNMYNVFQMLIREFGKNLMSSTLESVNSNLASIVQNGSNINVVAQNTNGVVTWTSSSMPSVIGFFELLRITNSNVVLLQKHFFMKIRPFVEGSRNELTLCQNEKNRLMNLLEDQLAFGLDQSLTIQIFHVAAILQKEQKAKHFRGGEGSDFHNPTPACVAVCTYVKQQYSIVANALDGRNHQTFLLDFANRFLPVLLKHIKTFEIQHGEGGIALMRDMSEYMECFQAWKIPKIDSDFSVLTAIAKLHLVHPQQLNDVISDSAVLSKMTKQDLDAFIRKRSDYDRSWLGTLY